MAMLMCTTMSTVGWNITGRGIAMDIASMIMDHAAQHLSACTVVMIELSSSVKFYLKE